MDKMLTSTCDLKTRSDEELKVIWEALRTVPSDTAWLEEVYSEMCLRGLDR